MTGIVCAVRGGLDSQPTIARAIALAQETDLPLYFLYVVNLDFLVRTSSTRIHTISEQMQQMGEFILLNAVTKAGEQDVNAEYFIRHGDVQDELIKLCLELSVNYVVMGQPRHKKTTNVFTNQQLSDFGLRIEEETGAVVILAEMRPLNEE